MPVNCLAPARARAARTSGAEREAQPATAARKIDAPVSGAQYGRLFPELPTLDTEERFLRLMGGEGGACDGSTVADDDATGAAGWPFFGQLLAHDLTADRSALVHHADPAALRNARRQKINLEFLYGAGPAGDPFLYDRNDPALFLLGSNDAGRPDDLLRNRQGIAVIGDPRNDSHVVMTQMHLAMQKLHNAVVAELRRSGVADTEVFESARRVTRWHYQWVIIHEFLPLLVGPAVAAELLADGPRYYHPQVEPYIPLEFADAAYRYGHSQIRHTYKLNRSMAPVPLFPDLIGFRPVPAARAVDWGLLFDLPGQAPAQRAKRIDGRLCNALMRLPVEITGSVSDESYHSLAIRDLQRGQAVGLPSGEAVARHIGVEPLTSDETGRLAALGWRGETPLWYYVLKEAESRADGDRLGPVGGRIVGEVIVGLLQHDPESVLAAGQTWKPTLPARSSDFRLSDLLAVASSAPVLERAENAADHDHPVRTETSR